MAKKSGEIHKNIEKSVKTGINEAEKERVNKQDKVEDKEQEQDGKKVDNEQPVEQAVMAGDISNVIPIQGNELDKTIEKNTKSAKNYKSTKPIDIMA